MTSLLLFTSTTMPRRRSDSHWVLLVWARANLWLSSSDKPVQIPINHQYLSSSCFHTCTPPLCLSGEQQHFPLAKINKQTLFYLFHNIAPCLSLRQKEEQQATHPASHQLLTYLELCDTREWMLIYLHQCHKKGKSTRKKVSTEASIWGVSTKQQSYRMSKKYWFSIGALKRLGKWIPLAFIYCMCFGGQGLTT